MTDIEAERFGLTAEEAQQLHRLKYQPKKRKPKNRAAPLLHPLALSSASPEAVLKSKVFTAYHADRFEAGAFDDLAMIAWRAYMDQRQEWIKEHAR